MKSIDPPFIATWILEHLVPGERNEALAGDLLEEFRSGRSAAWYWRQVLAAIAIATLREIRARSLLLGFAALWTLLAPAWWFFGVRFLAPGVSFVLPWPYSAVFVTAISALLSLWAGLAGYVLLYALIGRNFHLERVLRGLWIGPLLLFLFTTLPIRASLHRLGIGGTASLAGLMFLQHFLSLVAAAWKVRVCVVADSKVIAP
jgi:hypothetical protein